MITPLKNKTVSTDEDKEAEIQRLREQVSTLKRMLELMISQLKQNGSDRRMKNDCRQQEKRRRKNVLQMSKRKN